MVSTISCKVASIEYPVMDSADTVKEAWASLNALSVETIYVCSADDFAGDVCMKSHQYTAVRNSKARYRLVLRKINLKIRNSGAISVMKKQFTNLLQ